MKLEDVKDGDTVAVIELVRRDGEWKFKRLEKVKRRTPKIIWLDDRKDGRRFDIEGNCLMGGTWYMGSYKIRIPTAADLKAAAEKEATKNTADAENKRVAAVQASPLFATAKRIGWRLTDAIDDPDEYLAMAMKLGPEKLKQMEDWINEAQR